MSSLPHSHSPPSVSCHPIPSHHIPSRLANDYTEIQIADPRSICPPGFAQRGVPGCVSTAAPSLASSQLNKGLQPPEIKPHKGLLASLRQLPVLSSFPCHPPRSRICPCTGNPVSSAVKPLLPQLLLLQIGRSAVQLGIEEPVLWLPTSIGPDRTAPSSKHVFAHFRSRIEGTGCCRSCAGSKQLSHRR